MDRNNKQDNLYQGYLPPPELSKWASFWIFVWNSETQEFLGRTGKSWLKVIGFYVALYVFLSLFFWVMLKIFLNRLPNDRPEWILGESLIGTNPGMGFRPPPKRADSDLIWFKRGKGRTYDYYSESLDSFLQPYKDTKTPRQNCTWNPDAGKGLPCSFPVSNLGACSDSKNYGYDQNEPCILVKLNKIWGWVPEHYSSQDNITHLPDEVQALIMANKPHVWITCEGDSPTDKENIGPIKFYPKQGFPTYYYPFENDPGYLSPVVAIQFKKLTPGFLVNIECKAWAKNIEHVKMDGQGLVHYELMMD